MVAPGAIRSNLELGVWPDPELSGAIKGRREKGKRGGTTAKYSENAEMPGGGILTTGH
jgi:hypothetical protein